MKSKDFSEYSTVKYEIAATFEIQGVVEKSDVVGAIFGQTEGLLGEELDIRDLQKSGRIGRINVSMESKDGITSGLITIPSSLDRVETAILAATIETVDRVGPCFAKFKLQKLEDVRKTKRDKIIDRASELLKKWEFEVSPETQEITDAVVSSTISGEIEMYGEEKLPAGPEIETSDMIIVCEGRADVLNLLGIGLKNAIATNGTKVPKSIAELTKSKTVIAFLDGDRGGDMILNELLQVGKIDFVARAPEGKEVEDLTKKELLKALQSKTAYINNKPVTGDVFEKKRVEKPPVKKKPPQKKDQKNKRQKKNKFFKKRHHSSSRKGKPEPDTSHTLDLVPDALKETSKKILGTTKAFFYDDKLKVLKEVPTSMIVDNLQKEDGKVRKIVFDGIISQRLLDISSQEGVEMIIGTRVGNVNARNSKVKIYRIEQFLN